MIVGRDGKKRPPTYALTLKPSVAMRQKHLRLRGSFLPYVVSAGRRRPMLRSLDWLQESDGRWIKGWWDGYQGLKCSDYDEDWLAGFHAG